ncbi:DUF2189 domain-containing protein [Sulfitobacter sp. M57]|uniref:DUF2189 domain-containing protein n=1 Tax=unclassified Sulfitobacter TaxID=196795 RepID=UPI0023E0A07C|nr:MULTISPECIES: DUF2189 domain-containing protein [unclassified Sulfitobacter]MDF3416276.1 DUF2189 domain-containing protein [Sulfitobacter sp. KE5]MDF3423755.1 DUF2189 domain-containing protein [Sulfitobacter sp. KE43]MDF3434822.1 DUF2189 domain-containing protein [Sulfitobacter sp. KE42]MDF3460461.1 DUF2189 domain-containing protein [Sulfitobacter sp. S74]MDF3464359.1 DUF2189 domain-containing protein [Sulfitobacter sp. Ks18]
MNNRPHGAPELRNPTFTDLRQSLAAGFRDFLAAPGPDLFFASFYVIAGLVMGAITYATGTTFWLILAVMGFPLIGALAALGFYEVSRRRAAQEPLELSKVAAVVWFHRGEQLPWLAAIIIVAFLFWFFLGHMIFALFLGLSPMTNVSTSLEVFLTSEGLMMLGFGTVVGAGFALFVFAISVMGMPMLLDRDVDFITALLRSIAAVRAAPLVYLCWGGVIGMFTLLAMLPMFLGLFVVMPLLGHATWHLYRTLSGQA